MTKREAIYKLMDIGATKQEAKILLRLARRHLYLSHTPYRIKNSDVRIVYVGLNNYWVVNGFPPGVSLGTVS